MGGAPSPRRVTGREPPARVADSRPAPDREPGRLVDLDPGREVDVEAPREVGRDLPPVSGSRGYVAGRASGSDSGVERLRCSTRPTRWAGVFRSMDSWRT